MAKEPDHQPELLRQFRADPFGDHAPDLIRLLNQIRNEPARGKLALHRDASGTFRIICLSGERGVPPTRFDDRIFETLADAEWAVLCVRWERVTGSPPTL